MNPHFSRITIYSDYPWDKKIDALFRLSLGYQNNILFFYKKKSVNLYSQASRALFRVAIALMFLSLHAGGHWS